MEFLDVDTIMGEKSIRFRLSISEYNYICELLNSFYHGLKKLPKNMRTPKFYLLENMIETKFKYTINDD